jgi:hypothetical protein
MNQPFEGLRGKARRPLHSVTGVLTVCIGYLIEERRTNK